MACDDNGTATRSYFWVVAVFGSHSGFVDCGLEDLGVFVVAYTAEEDDGFGWEHVLGAAGGVLGGSAGEKVGGVVVDEIFVDAQMFLFGENGIVGFEAVFVEEGLVSCWRWG